MTPAEKREIVQTLRTEDTVRQICDTLGFNRSSLYYQPKKDPCEAGLQQEIEKLSACYPRYGYRRMTELLLRPGYTVGYRRVARLMKSANLLVSAKRTCQTTKSLDDKRQWGNRLDTLDTGIRSGLRMLPMSGSKDTSSMFFMDVWTRMIRGWQLFDTTSDIGPPCSRH